ncbi:MAG: energy transducer TonB [bacterium]
MLSDNPLKVTILVSILIHVLFLGIPEGILKFLSPEVEASREFIAQIAIEKPPPPQKIEKPRPKPKPKEPEPEAEEAKPKPKEPEEVIEEPKPASLPEEKPVVEPVQVEEPQVTPQPVEQVTIAKIDVAKIAILNYQTKVRRKIEQAKRYPAFARKNEIEGVVKVRFTILSDGSVDKIEICQSSGSSLLDKEACSTIKRAASFPPIPEEVGRSQIQMQVNIVFTCID